MRWRIVPVEDSEAKPEDLTNDELVGISVRLNPFWGAGFRIWEKIQPQVSKAIEAKLEEKV